MATNNLAPQATGVNRLIDWFSQKINPSPEQAPTQTSLPSEWSKFVMPNSAAYEAAVLLNATGQLPKINFTNISKNGRSGEYDRESNSINIDSKTNSQSTLPHELTHALRYVLQNKVREMGASAQQTGNPLVGINKQLFDAYYKLDPDFFKIPKLNYPDQEYQNYRYSYNEAPAFGVGNMESKADYYSTSPGGRHYDATMATEQAILRDLYARQLNVNLKK